jgi:hypothetical protein
MKYILTILMTAIVSVVISYFAFSQYFVDKIQKETVPEATVTSGVGSMITELQKDVDMYRDLFIYLYLLDKDLYSKLGAIGEELQKDKALNDYLTLFYAEAIFKKSPEIQNSITKIIGEVKAKKTADTYFEKSTTCSSLTSDIKNDLVQKPKSEYGNTITEEFGFIFYSPNLDTCIYVTDYKSMDSKTFESDNYKKVYNANTQTLVNSYTVSLYGQWDDSEKERKANSGAQDFVRYILENSNYNASLLKGSEYINTGM